MYNNDKLAIVTIISNKRGPLNTRINTADPQAKKVIEKMKTAKVPLVM